MGKEALLPPAPGWRWAAAQQGQGLPLRLGEIRERTGQVSGILLEIAFEPGARPGGGRAQPVGWAMSSRRHPFPQSRSSLHGARDDTPRHRQL